MDLILIILDLLGTFVFALSGALVGVRHRLDLFGVLVLSFVAGNGGGTMLLAEQSTAAWAAGTRTRAMAPARSA